MVDNQKSRDRALQRCYECHRLEEQLWAMAYEQLWPLVCRRARGAAKPVPSAPTNTPLAKARRA